MNQDGRWLKITHNSRQVPTFASTNPRCRHTAIYCCGDTFCLLTVSTVCQSDDVYRSLYRHGGLRVTNSSMDISQKHRGA